MENHKELGEGCFDTFLPVFQELIKEIVSCFHYRNGMENDDGSLGQIKISPKELRDMLSYAVTAGLIVKLITNNDSSTINARLHTAP